MDYGFGVTQQQSNKLSKSEPDSSPSSAISSHNQQQATPSADTNTINNDQTSTNGQSSASHILSAEGGADVELGDSDEGSLSLVLRSITAASKNVGSTQSATADTARIPNTSSSGRDPCWDQPVIPGYTFYRAWARTNVSQSWKWHVQRRVHVDPASKMQCRSSHILMCMLRTCKCKASAQCLCQHDAIGSGVLNLLVLM